MAVVVLGLALTAAARVWSLTEQRERERQLLFVGHEYRNAIGLYLAHLGHYPTSLEELLGTADSAVPQRFLRRLYPDPMTGEPNWTLIQSPDGAGIMGVASSSDAAPIKRANFEPSEAAFEDAKSYQAWRFIYVQRYYRRATNPASP
ncbi:MAG: type II secretion system protein [Proteobacteria bacterium]|nr:type II secretion system protein [Pseudomonadota bacterium]